jgi:hypothetical protein
MTLKADGTNGVLQQYDYQVSTTGFSYTFAAGTTVLVMNPAGTLATGTITMPAAPADGMTISFSSTQTITALTVAGNTGQSIVGNPTTLNAGGGASFVYRLANTTWYAQVNTAVSSTGVPVLNVFTSTSTYTKPATVKAIKVTVVGGGGNGGAAPSNPTGAVGGAGGGGGASIFIYPAPSLPVSAIPYTVGAAASTSSFGVAPLTVITATGGTSGTAAVSGVPGAGGIGSGGTLNVGGSGGSAGSAAAPTFGGAAGSSMLGGGARGRTTVGNGDAGQQYGGGGGGGVNPGGGPASGGAGAQGVVIVEEFY